MRLALLVVGSMAFAAACMPPQASPLVESATQPASIPITPAPLLPHEPLPLGPVGTNHTISVDWSFKGGPKDGFDALRLTMTPVIADNPAQNNIYWAMQGWWTNGQAYYFGLQPNGAKGKTALFSVFGEGATPEGPACVGEADNGAGAGCHIAYPWVLGHPYQFIVRLAGGDTRSMVWEGVVVDVTTGAVTVIGDIAVQAARGLLKPETASFSEFFTKAPCPQEPRSEVLLQQATGYRNGQPFAGGPYKFNANSSCNPGFFGDGKTYVYQASGG